MPKEIDVDQVAEDHHHIRGLLEELSAERDTAKLFTQLSELIVVLREHFVLEEQLHRAREIDSLDRAPNAPQLRAVLDEHPQLLSEATRLRAILEATPNYEQVGQQIAAFVEKMRDHESRETEEFMKAMWTDVGGG